MVAKAFNASTGEAKAGGSVRQSPAWSTKRVPGQSGLLHKENFSKRKPTPPT
ncbi:hypothetical protein I79_026235 [Cricetulus griseus]|uniref:Uncharacterized protein n=1 Tax=Cricetulus griseus TaxID=10029 RepID=G3IQC2_CRIGR|nr:hypothetical protein I79_026235 [Cricetulus griseus]